MRQIAIYYTNMPTDRSCYRIVIFPKLLNEDNEDNLSRMGEPSNFVHQANDCNECAWLVYSEPYPWNN